MSQSTTIIDIRGKAFSPVITEMLFENYTIKNNYVDFCDDVKSNLIFTENTNTVVMQAYTENEPSWVGTISTVDKIITPIKIMFADKFGQEVLRSSRFSLTMGKGAWNTASSEYESLVYEAIGGKIVNEVENKFWNGCTVVTSAATAALSTGTTNASISTQEKAYTAAAPVSLFDGVITKVIYNNSAVGARTKITGTTITSSNIATEYAKVYAEMSDAFNFGQGQERPIMYVPRSHKKLINIYNINATYRDLFSKEGDKYFYNDVEIAFVPVSDNIIYLNSPSNIKWLTDSMDDLNYLYVDRLSNFSDYKAYKAVMTIECHIVNQVLGVLYVG